tara:strand:- start:381 stop:632 length:252 start_codon:yes stop_codon:yes gene_type:complete
MFAPSTRQNKKNRIMANPNQTYYLVEYECPYDGRQSEGVFTEKGWEKYVQEQNKDRDTSEESLLDECMEENEDFIFTEIEVYN